jgi:RNA polymerase sigma factor (sigma-70 family)
MELKGPEEPRTLQGTEAEATPSGGGLEEFFRNERERLVAFTRRLIDEAGDRDPEDIVQDVMEALLNLADPIRSVKNLGGYVYQAIRNRVIDTFRSRKPAVSLDAQTPETGASLHDLVKDERFEPSSLFTRTEALGALREAIDRLSPAERAVVLATEIDRRSFEELSEEWDEPVGTLLSRKSRAMKRLAARLSTRQHRLQGGTL